MEKIREFLQKPLYAGIVGFVVGLIIGLPILGWWLFPVKWKDLDATTLRQDLKDQYLCMVVDSYRVNQNGELAKARLDAMGENLQNRRTCSTLCRRVAAITHLMTCQSWH